MTPAPLVASRVRVTGRVQGVGFRAHARERALAEGLVGWVRNAEDGGVEAFVQGAPAAVDAMLDWMRRGGPPAGRVDQLDARGAAPDPTATAFVILR